MKDGLLSPLLFGFGPSVEPLASQKGVDTGPYSSSFEYAASIHITVLQGFLFLEFLRCGEESIRA